MTTPPILSLLTDDLLARILDYLPEPSDKKSFRSSCKSFHRVESTHRTRIRFLLPEFIPVLLAKYPNLESLDFSVCPRFDNGLVAALLNRSACWMGRVRTLVLNRTTGLGFPGLNILVRVCPFLEAVDVSYCSEFGDREAAALSRAGGLRELRMDKCLNLSDVGLARLAVGCGRLERLSLKWCLEITDLGVDLLLRKCPHLKHLDISYLKVTSESLRAIGRLEKLEVLIMVGCGLLDDLGLESIGNGCSSLQVLDVSRCENFSSFGIASVVRGCKGLQKLNAGYSLLELSEMVLIPLKNLKNLKTIRIDGARVSDPGFNFICTNCPFLVEVGLSKCKGVTDTGITYLVAGCPGLKILDLTCCDALTDMAISSIASSCRGLLCLKLESCALLTEKSLECLGFSCSSLMELDLTECCVNDTGLRCLSTCSELLYLKLGFCTNISDRGLSYLASHCLMMRELDLYRCLGIGDNGLAALASGCKRLRKINLSYCSEVTDKGLEKLSFLEELSDVELRGLTNVVGSGLTAIASRCTNLSELDLKHCDSINDSGFWSLACYARNLQQINLSYCSISDVALCMLVGNLTRLQDLKLVNLRGASVHGVELALRASSARLKKVKLATSIRFYLSPDVLEILGSRGCKIRWN